MKANAIDSNLFIFFGSLVKLSNSTVYVGKARDTGFVVSAVVAISSLFYGYHPRVISNTIPLFLLSANILLGCTVNLERPRFRPSRGTDRPSPNSEVVAADNGSAIEKTVKVLTRLTVSMFFQKLRHCWWCKAIFAEVLWNSNSLYNTSTGTLLVPVNSLYP